MKNVYIKDIVARNNLNSDQEISELVDILASGISSLTNPRKLENTFKSVKNSTLCASTIDKYIGYLKDSFLLSKAERYDVKGKKYISTPYKLYFEDTGLRNARLNFRQIEETHLMENIIYNELRYRGYNVDVGVVEFREKLTKVRIYESKWKLILWLIKAVSVTIFSLLMKYLTMKNGSRKQDRLIKPMIHLRKLLLLKRV